MGRINSKFLVIAFSVLMLIYFVIFPMGVLLYDSVIYNGSINFENYRNVYSQDVNWRALTNTINLSLLVMVASVIITFFSDQKIKKSDDDMSISLKRTQDILKYLGENKKNQFLCGFSMETQNMVENSVKKLKKKNADMIVANNLKDAGSGFGTDTNAVVIITRDKEEALSLMTKEEVAREIVNRILAQI